MGFHDSVIHYFYLPMLIEQHLQFPVRNNLFVVRTSTAELESGLIYLTVVSVPVDEAGLGRVNTVASVREGSRTSALHNHLKFLDSTAEMCPIIASQGGSRNFPRFDAS